LTGTCFIVLDAASDAVPNLAGFVTERSRTSAKRKTTPVSCRVSPTDEIITRPPFSAQAPQLALFEPPWEPAPALSLLRGQHAGSSLPWREVARGGVEVASASDSAVRGGSDVGANADPRQADLLEWRPKERVSTKPKPARPLERHMFDLIDPEWDSERFEW
jgi:hypothetical protein